MKILLQQHVRGLVWKDWQEIADAEDLLGALGVVVTQNADAPSRQKWRIVLTYDYDDA